MYYNSVSLLMYVIVVFILAVGAGLGFLISKKPVINKIICGFFSGMSIVLLISSVGLYKVGSLWFLYPMMFVMGGIFAILAYRFREKLFLEVFNQTFLGTYLATIGLGLLFGAYPNPFI